MHFRFAAVAVLGLALAACGGGPSASPSVSPATATACRLPVYNWGPVTNNNSSSIAGKNGFLSLPAGTFSADAAGVLIYDEATHVVSTQEPPHLKGDSSIGSYDAPRGRWLPAARSNVLPDGSAYVYELELSDGTGFDIHLVDVPAARDTLIYHMPYDNGYRVLGFEPGSVYVYPILHRSGLPSGLWRLDVATRTLSAIPNSMDMTWEWVAAGLAWGGPGGAAGDSLYSLDLKSGALTKWFQHPVQGAVFEGFGYGVSVFAFDRSGHPLVQVYPPPPGATSPQTPPMTPELWILNAPGQATQLSGLPIPENGLTTGVTDSRGTWVVGGDGVYLYTETGFHRMAGLPPQPMPNYTLDGPCA